MEFLRLIEERRSIRAYKESEISREDIEKMIYAAQQAPSWKNSQTGRYYVALSKEAVAELRNTCLPSFNYERTENVSAFIVAAYKKGFSGFKPDGSPTDASGDGWGAYDLGLQNENLLLVARELGYDTLIMGLRNEAKLREMFGIPVDEIVMSVIAVGKRAADPEKPERKSLCNIAKFL